MAYDHRTKVWSTCTSLDIRINPRLSIIVVSGSPARSSSKIPVDVRKPSVSPPSRTRTGWAVTLSSKDKVRLDIIVFLLLKLELSSTDLVGSPGPSSQAHPLRRTPTDSPRPAPPPTSRPHNLFTIEELELEDPKLEQAIRESLQDKIEAKRAKLARLRAGPSASPRQDRMEEHRPTKKARVGSSETTSGIEVLELDSD